MIPRILGFTCAALVATPAAVAQGTGAYFNVESPQRKPIAVARVAGHDYLVACNTPDNCVEIYDTHTNAFLQRVQTGAEPISVVYNSELGKLFTCNFLGDSVSVIALSASSSAGPLSATLERTTYVGDEPNHLAFAPDDLSVFVTLGSQSAVAHLSTTDLTAVTSGSERIDLVDDATLPTKALKDPCTALVKSNQLFVLGHRGGKQHTMSAGFPAYDFDVRAIDLSTGVITQVGGLGTANFNMAFDAAGDLWVVGGDAQFEAFLGEAAVKAAPFGFVRSVIWRVSGAGTATPVVVARDLNADTSGAQVPSSAALAQPTDVVPYEPGGSLQKLYVAAFNSDRVGVVTPSGAPSAWTITGIAIPTGSPPANPMSGPRGLAIKYASGIPSDPGDLVYVLNRLDNSVSVIDPATDTVVRRFALQRDPTPSYVRAGRQFLYGAQHSASGIVSCASCHLDGRSDNLLWDLSDNSTQPFPPGIKDSPTNGDPSAPNFPPNKGFLFTQTLQGMVNFETLPEAQSYFTNEPLHWRGDRASFLDFNPAFVNLLGRSSELANGDMEAYRDFVFSIAYPPNPEQPIARTFSGAIGDTANETTGSGAKRGLKLFHMRRLGRNDANGGVCGGRSCVQCHWLPEGSNNKITLSAANVTDPGNRQPLETAAFRMIRQKERTLEKNGSTTSAVLTGIFGLAHEGTADSINSFVENGFSGDFDPDEFPDLKQFVRELDPGVGPLVGRSYTITSASASSSRTAALFTLFETQAGLVNHGFAIQARINGVQRGFWYDLTVEPPVFREEPSTATFTRGTLLALLSASTDVLVVHATPLGSERRFAWVSAGAPTPIAGTPSDVTLEPVVTNSAYADVPSFTKNWIPGTGPDDFDWKPAIPTPPSIRAVRILQHALVNAGTFGLTALRHEAPRRFRVAMNGGQHGAKLVLEMGTDGANPPPNSTTFATFVLPLYPTKLMTNEEEPRRIWETAVEADALTIYALMLGGPAAPNVQATIDGTFSTEPPAPTDFDPATWNSFRVHVVNESALASTPAWQAITIQ